MIAVYPDNVWYTYVDKDIDEIIGNTSSTAAWLSA